MCQLARTGVLLTKRDTMKVKYDNSELNVVLPTDMLHGVATVNDIKVPSAKVREALIDGADKQTIAALAVDSSVFSFTKKLIIVATTKPPLRDDTIIKDGYMADRTKFWLVRREENIRIRPWMLGTMARFEMEPNPEVLFSLFSYMKKHNRGPVAAVDKKYFFVKAEDRDKVFEHFGVSSGVNDNGHILTRIGVLMKRPGGLMQTITTPTERFAENDNDGTIMISSSITEPRPGTMRLLNGTALYLKGMIRPPLIIEGMVRECEGLVADAQFGHCMPDGKLEAEFAAVRTMPKERASLNYQAILFGAVIPHLPILTDNVRLANAKIADLFTSEEVAKIEAGVPPALLMRQYSPWKWLTQFKIDGARATVYGSDLVPVGCVRMLPDTFKHFCTEKVIEDMYDDEMVVCEWPHEIVLHRDPAVPDASSMSIYELIGEAKWEGATGGHGIVVNPKDPAWRRAGGDFDGDAAVAFIPNFALKRMLEDEKGLKLNSAIGLASFEGRSSMASTMIAMADGYTSRLGPAVMASMRMRERNKLTQEIASLAKKVIQGTVDAKKHHVDTKEGMILFAELKEAESACKPSEGFLLDYMHKVRRASGVEAKVNAWKELVLHANTRQCGSSIEMAMVQRIVALNDIFTKTQWLRGDRVVLPDNMKVTALAWLMERDDPDTEVQLTKVLARDYRNAVRKHSEATEAGNEDLQLEASEEILTAKLSLRVALRDGYISDASLVAYGPHRLAAELVSADSFKRLGQEQAYLETALFGTEWIDGEYKVTDLDPVPSAADELRLRLRGKTKVSLKVISEHGSFERVCLSW